MSAACKEHKAIVNIYKTYGKEKRHHGGRTERRKDKNDVYLARLESDGALHSLQDDLKNNELLTCCKRKILSG